MNQNEAALGLARIKSLVISTQNVSDDVMIKIMENLLKSDESDNLSEKVEVLEGQMSLWDAFDNEDYQNCGAKQ